VYILQVQRIRQAPRSVGGSGAGPTTGGVQYKCLGIPVPGAESLGCSQFVNYRYICPHTLAVAQYCGEREAFINFVMIATGADRDPAIVEGLDDNDTFGRWRVTPACAHTFADEGDDSTVAQQVEQIVITEPISGNASGDSHQQQHYVAASGSSGAGARTVRNLRGHDSGMNLRHQQHDTSSSRAHVDQQHEMFAAEQIVVSKVDLRARKCDGMCAG
jgi:hypothetical protein